MSGSRVPLCLGAGLAAHAGRELVGGAVDLDLDGGGRRLAQAGDGLRQDACHHGVALDPGGLRRIRDAGVDAGEQRAGGGQHDVVLAERGQHLIDVAQERGARADDQDPAPRQSLSVRIEEVGGPVQRDDGLPGARPALDDEDPARVLADDAVLVGLDGGDDVAHPPGPAAAQRRQQRGLAGQVGLVDGVQVEHVVVQAHDPPAGGVQVAAPGHAAPLPRGGAVERLRRAGTPVDQQLLVILAAQAEPADVEPVIVVEVQAAEAQVPLRGVEFRGAVLVLLGQRLALRTIPGRSPRSGRGAPRRAAAP